MSLIEIHDLCRSYGAITAVDNFSLTAERGTIVALVGPDGAGKTTIFRAACGLLGFETGTITIAGLDVKTQFDSVKPLLGYMPQNFSLYPDLSVEENLSFYAGLFGLNKQDFHQKKKRLYDFSNLGPFADRRAEALSGGMKQKLALSCNLIHDPQVLVLDEPTTGVDPLSRRQFWDILKTLRNDGSTIIVSTPYMDEVALADKSIFIFNGKNMAEGTPDELTALFRGRVYSLDRIPNINQMESINALNGISARRFGSTMHIYIEPGREVSEYSGEFSHCGFAVDDLREIRPELEDTFIQLMEQA
jgi:ABC-2 type transport system ATP-binding protein